MFVEFVEDTVLHSTYMCMYVCESFSERVSELTHPKLPIYSFEIYYKSKQ